MALPTFHILGIYSQLLYPVYGIVCSTVFPPKVLLPADQPFIPTPSNILDHLERTKSNWLLIIPALLHIWAQSEPAMNILRSLLSIVSNQVSSIRRFQFSSILNIETFGGGPIAKKHAKTLFAAGVNISSVYGATEFGAVTVLGGPFRDRIPDESQWLKFSPRVNIRWVEQGLGKYECQIMVRFFPLKSGKSRS